MEKFSPLIIAINPLGKPGLKHLPIMKNTLPVILILLWTFTGMEKLIRFKDSRKAFLNQPMPQELEEVLAYAIPGIELLLAILLLFSATRWWGYLGSALLLTVFITYVGLIWVGAFPRVPCNCAGLIDNMGWVAHFWMNLGLIGIGIWGLWLEGWKVKSQNPEDC